MAKELAIRVWFIDQQPGYHLGACKKYRNSFPISDQLDQTMHFNKIPSKCYIIVF